MADEKPKLIADVAVENVERPHGNMFGKMLNKYRAAKMLAVMDAKNKMFTRHQISYTNQKYYKIVEDRTTRPSGKEVIELRLYQLIDAAVVTMNPDVTSELNGGINQLREFDPNETGQKNPSTNL